MHFDRKEAEPSPGSSDLGPDISNDSSQAELNTSAYVFTEPRIQPDVATKIDVVSAIEQNEGVPAISQERLAKGQFQDALKDFVIAAVYGYATHYIVSQALDLVQSPIIRLWDFVLAAGFIYLAVDHGIKAWQHLRIR